MLMRMLMHSLVFTVVIALGAVTVNGAGLLDGGKPEKGSFSSFLGGSADRDDHDWKRREFDDD